MTALLLPLTVAGLLACATQALAAEPPAPRPTARAAIERQFAQPAPPRARSDARLPGAEAAAIRARLMARSGAMISSEPDSGGGSPPTGR